MRARVTRRGGGQGASRSSLKDTQMVREATFAWDLTEGRLDPIERRDSVLDDDLLVLSRPRRKKRRMAADISANEKTVAERAPTARRHLAGAAWTTGDLHRHRRTKSWSAGKKEGAPCGTRERNEFATEAPSCRRAITTLRFASRSRCFWRPPIGGRCATKPPGRVSRWRSCAAGRSHRHCKRSAAAAIAVPFKRSEAVSGRASDPIVGGETVRSRDSSVLSFLLRSRRCPTQFLAIPVQPQNRRWTRSVT